MERNLVNLPIAGIIQHGLQKEVNGKKRTQELGYFIAKETDQAMKFIVDKFNKVYDKALKIDIIIPFDEAFSIKRARYTTSGLLCYCMDGQTQAKQKGQNGWQDIECSTECQYRQVPKVGKSPCSEVATLRFFIPNICKDRLFIMQIRSRTAIEKLREYFALQKAFKNSIKGHYTLFLSKVKQTSKQGKSFENYIVDIIEKDEAYLSNNNLQQQELSTNFVQNVDKTVSDESNSINKTTTPIQTKVINNSNTEKADNQKQQEKKTTAKSTTKKVETKVQDQKTTVPKQINKETIEDEEIDENEHPEVEATEETMKKYYLLVDTTTKEFKKNGKIVNHVIGNFVNANNEQLEIVIPPKYSNGLLKCDSGTSVLMDLNKAGELTFTNKITYIQKCLKQVAA